MKTIIFSWHAKKRLRESRQKGIGMEDVIKACHKASEILYKPVPEPLKLKGFRAGSGRVFDIAVVDVPDGLLVTTVIGDTKGRGKQYGVRHSEINSDAENRRHRFSQKAKFRERDPF